jgi:hypothetical protein
MRDVTNAMSGLVALTMSIGLFGCGEGTAEVFDDRPPQQAEQGAENSPSNGQATSQPADEMGESTSALGGSKLPLYWYSSVNKHSGPRNDLTSIAMPYAGVFKPGTNDQKGKFYFGNKNEWGRVQTYLDNAKAAGTKVILDVKLGVEELSYQTHHDNPYKTGGPSAQAIIDFVKRFDTHPAVEGWYVQDEPSLSFRADVSKSKYDEGYIQGYHKTRAGYRLIKEAQWGGSTKPVFLGLSSGPEVHSGAFEDSAAYKFRFAYDVLMTHFYPFRKTTSHLEASEIRWQFEKFRQCAIRARQLGKPLRITLQAFGDDAWRLPSSREFEFMTYGALIAANDMDALGFYSQHQLEDDSPANSNYPYKKSGKEWLNEVWAPTMSTVNQIGTSFRHPVRGLSAEGKYGADVEAGIRGHIFRHPTTGGYDVVVLNNSAQTVESWIEPRNASGTTLPDGTFKEARVITNGSTFSLAANKQAVRLTFAPWEGKIVRFVR